MTDDDRDENGYRLRPYPDQLRLFLDALWVVLEQTGPKAEPPGFAAAIAAGETWPDSEILKRWIAVDRVIDAYPGDKYSPPADRWGKDDRVWLQIDGPLERSFKLLMVIRIRWQYPFEPWSRKINVLRGKWKPAIDSQWYPIVAPVLEPRERETLKWAFDALGSALARVPPDEPGEAQEIDGGDEGEEPVTFEPAASEDEDERDETPDASPIPGAIDLVLGEPGDQPLIWGIAVSPAGLTPRRRKILKALLESGPDGLSTSELEKKTREKNGHRMLADLCADYPVWRRVVDMPERPWGRYRLHQSPPDDEPGEPS